MTDAYRLAEPLVAALVDRLTANLPATVAQINQDRSDDFPLDPPAQVLDYIPTVAELTAFPTLGIQDLPSRFEDDIGSSATGVHELAVITFCADADQRTLATVLRRYAQAVATVAMEGRQLGDDGWGTTLVGVYPGPTLEAEEEPRSWMSWTAVRVRCKRDE